MIRFRVDKSDRQFIKPKQVERASRLAINQITNEIHKDLGGDIPKTHGTSITGYRRVRSKKTLAKSRKRTMRGVVWQGTMDIPARYAGKSRNVSGGAKAGRHYFPGAFVATVGKNKYRGIFKRIKGSNKLEQVYIELTQAKALANRKAQQKLLQLPAAFRKQYRKQIKR